jgi:hypothetical protein
VAKKRLAKLFAGTAAFLPTDQSAARAALAAQPLCGNADEVLTTKRTLKSLGRLTLAAALALAAAPLMARPSEQAVKAAFIPKFARYVQWPAAHHPGPRQPFSLCVIGRDPFGPLLDRAAASEQIGGRAVNVRRLPSADGAAGCHLAFVRGATPLETSRLLLALRSQPVLTITDSRAGPQRGMIHFTRARGRVRFFIDDAAAAEHGLSISSRLLALALGVRQRRT